MEEEAYGTWSRSIPPALAGTTMGIGRKRCRSNKVTKVGKVLVTGARGYYYHSCHLMTYFPNSLPLDGGRHPSQTTVVASSSLEQIESGEVQVESMQRQHGRPVGLYGEIKLRNDLCAQGPRR